MKKRMMIAVSIVLVICLCWSLASCSVIEKVLDKAEQILEEAEETKTNETVNSSDTGTDNGNADGKTDNAGGKTDNGNTGRTEDKTDVDAGTGTAVLREGDLSFHFLTLGNKYTGDSTYIKIGEVDILIDAGSRQNSAATIIDYVKDYCTDGKLEYVIATHAHQDHIAGFVGTKGVGVLNAFEIGTIIEFAKTNATSAIYTNYCTARDAAVARGAKVYTALDCWKGEKGAQRSYTLAEGVTMDVLYNYYYEHETSEENDYSVCVMFNYGDSHYLFTGDLEKEGESYLVDNNELPHCTLFKGGHHGSYTASTGKLLGVIQPDVVCVCCCCGSTEYTSVKDNTFPSQAFFNRVLPYTDRIFATSMVELVPDEDDPDEYDEQVKDMNGNIVVVTDGTALTVTCSSSATPVPYTAWFDANRVWPEGIKELYEESAGGNNGGDSGGSEGGTSASMDTLKIGLITLHDSNDYYDKPFVDGLNSVKQELGIRDDQVVIATGVAESSACYDAAVSLAESGCNVIIADSYGHEAYIIQAARQYPDVIFAHATGTHAHTENLDNFVNAFASIYEGRYLAGVVAGLKLQELVAAGKEAKVGYVGAYPYAEVISGYTAWFLGVKSIVPEATMEVTFTANWNDESAERAAAAELISRGCVIISQYSDSMGAPEACETYGVPNVSYNGSTAEKCPNTFLVSSRINWAPYYKYLIECRKNGTKPLKDYVGTIATGSVELTALGTACAAGTQAKIDEVKAGLANGTIKVFDTSTFTVSGAPLTTYLADVDDFGDFVPETEVIAGGQFQESKYRSAPYFDVRIDDIVLLDELY